MSVMARLSAIRGCTVVDDDVELDAVAVAVEEELASKPPLL